MTRGIAKTNTAGSTSGASSQPYQGNFSCNLATVVIRPRPKPSDPAHESVGLQPGRDGRVRCSAWLDFLKFGALLASGRCGFSAPAFSAFHYKLGHRLTMLINLLIKLCS